MLKKENIIKELELIQLELERDLNKNKYSQYLPENLQTNQPESDDIEATVTNLHNILQILSK